MDVQKNGLAYVESCLCISKACGLARDDWNTVYVCSRGRKLH